MESRIDELIEKLELILKAATSWQRKEWLSEAEVEKEYGFKKDTMRKYREHPENPLPYSKFSDDSKTRYYHRTHLNRRLLENMVGLTPREKKKQEQAIVYGN